MDIVVHNTTTGERTVRRVSAPVVWIGRDEQCDVRIPTYFVTSRHARIQRDGQRLILESFGINGTFCNGVELQRGTPRQIGARDVIRIAEYELTVVGGEAESREALEQARLMTRVMEVEQRLHARLLQRMDLRTAPLGSPDGLQEEAIRRHLEAVLDDEIDRIDPVVRDFIVRLAVKREVLGHLDNSGAAAGLSSGDPTGQYSNQRFEQAIRESVRRLGRSLGFELRRETRRADLERLEAGFDDGWRRAAIDLSSGLGRYVAKRWLRKELSDIVFGFGPLQDLIELASVTEIMVVRRDQIYVEIGGMIEDSGRRFLSDEMVIAVLERIVAPLGRRIDRSVPIVDARLPDGSRVNAIIPPLAVSGPCITIRKFSRQPLTAENLIASGSMSVQVAEFLKACVAGRKNVVVSGGTGSGKTTLLNVLSSFIPPHERIVTIEDSAELRLVQKHVVTLETRPANVEGVGAYTIRDLVKNALRMRPDRVIVGECRGGEALDMLQAMNTGHDGSMTTGHANTPADMVLRLETMVLMAVDMPITAIRKQIAAAIDVIVQMERFGSGQRRLTAISEVVGIDPDRGEVILEDVFAPAGEASGQAFRLGHTGYIPSFAEDLIERGMLSLDALFG